MSKTWKVVFLVALAIAFIVSAYLLRAIFLPLLVALILAYILNPIISALENRRIPRVASIVGVYVILAGVLAGLLFWAVPTAIGQAKEFIHDTFLADNAKIKGVIVWGDTRLRDWLGAENWDQAVKNLGTRMQGRETELAQAGGKIVGTILSIMTQSIGSFITVLGFVALVPVYLFFLLRNMNPWWERVKRCVPRSYRDRTLATLGRIHRANAAFFRGQLTICAIEGLIVFIVLSLIGVKFSLLFGAMYAILTILPFLGVVVGFTVTELFVLADTGGFTTTFFLVAGLYAAIQVLEGMVFQPLILGKETGLHPIAIILALLICGEVFGFFGMLIGVPIATTVKILLEDYVWPVFEEVADLTRVRTRPSVIPSESSALPSTPDRSSEAPR